MPSVLRDETDDNADDEKLDDRPHGRIAQKTVETVCHANLHI